MVYGWIDHCVAIDGKASVPDQKLNRVQEKIQRDQFSLETNSQRDCGGAGSVVTSGDLLQLRCVLVVCSGIFSWHVLTFIGCNRGVLPKAIKCVFLSSSLRPESLGLHLFFQIQNFAFQLIAPHLFFVACTLWNVKQVVAESIDTVRLSSAVP